MSTTRRSFLRQSAAVAAGLAVLPGNSGKANDMQAGSRAGLPRAKDPDAFKLSIFSKHLQWLDYREMAKAVREMGFDGVDLTVRPEGHVLPGNVERDLPKAVEAVEKEGRKVYMLTTAVIDADDPVSEKILKTAASLGIRHYRMGYGYYGRKRTVSESTVLVNSQLDKMARLNEKYSISGEYQNHSGDYGSGIYFGGPVWDLLSALKRIDSPYLGSQYDIYHATIEGANAWPVALELISPYIGTMDIKDFAWAKKDGRWSSETVPLGEGAVDLRSFFGQVKRLNISCPLSVHYEYPTGGAENGAREITLGRDELLSIMRKDLLFLKDLLKEADLV